MTTVRASIWIVAVAAALALTASMSFAQQKAKKGKAAPNGAGKAGGIDAKDIATGKPPEARDPEFAKYAIYEQSAPRPAAAPPIATSLPLVLQPGDRIGFIGNTLFERAQLFGQVEALLHQRFP